MKEIIMGILSMVLFTLFLIGIVFGFCFLMFKMDTKLEKEHPCIKSHEETQQEMPLSIVNGGIAIPIGNITTKTVTICDERK